MKKTYQQRLQLALSVLVAVLSCFAILAALSGCGGGGGGGMSGSAGLGSNFRLAMKDAPGSYEHVYITTGTISVLGPSGTITVTTTPQTLDLIALQNVDSEIGTANLPPGKYTQIRFQVTSAQVVDDTGTTYPLTVPSGSQTGIKLVNNFTITAGQLTSIVLDFNAAQSVVQTGSGKYLLKPVIKVSAVVVPTGEISGTLLSSSTSQPIPASSNPLVTAYPAGSPTDGSVPASGTVIPSATDGTYTLTELPVGSYDLYFSANGYTTQLITSVAVTANTTTTVATVSL